MLTLYILKTNEPNRSVIKTKKSVEGGPLRQWRVVESVEDINKHKYRQPWFVVLYDNEYLSYDLRKAVKAILRMEHIEYDALKLVKKSSDGKLYQCPRLFRKHVKLAENSLLPADRSIKMERILDGWIFEHAN